MRRSHIAIMGLFLVLCSLFAGCDLAPREAGFTGTSATAVFVFPPGCDADLSAAQLRSAIWLKGFTRGHGPREWMADVAENYPGRCIEFPTETPWEVIVEAEDVAAFFASVQGRVEGLSLGRDGFHDLNWDDPRWQEVRWLDCGSSRPENPPTQFRSLQAYRGRRFTEDSPLCQALKNSPKLTSLHLLSGARDDSWFAKLPGGMTVESLTLSEFEEWGTPSVAPLSTWPELVTLTYFESDLSLDMIRGLGQCAELRNVRFYDCEVPEGAIAALAELPAIEELIIVNCELPSTAAVELEALPQLKRLAIDVDKTTPGLIEAIGRLDGLELLWITYTSLPTAELGMLGDLAGLRSFKCDYDGPDFSHSPEEPSVREVIDAIASSGRGLEQLSIRHARDWKDAPAVMTDADAALLVEIFPNLRDLRLPLEVAITDAGLASLCELDQLEVLAVRSTGSLSTEVLAGLESLPNLKHLEIGQVDNAGAAEIGKLTQLESLVISGSMDDEAVASLLRIKGLEYLDVNETRITVEGVRQLAGLRMLRRITAIGFIWWECRDDRERGDDEVLGLFSSKMLLFEVGDESER